MPTDPLQVRSLCAFLGSFDPPHKGHEWLVDTLLDRFDLVLMLVPGRHFEKTILPPQNATLEQRLDMLALLARRKRNRIATGLAHEVLFIRLADRLVELFPQAHMGFGMGNETFDRLRASKTYYERSGLAWTAEEEKKLERLKRHVVIFGRSTNGSDTVDVPRHLRRLSSTLVRKTVKELRNTSVSKEVWTTTLEHMINSDILEYVIQKEIYGEWSYDISGKLRIANKTFILIPS